MNVLIEKELQITLPKEAKAKKFDDPKSHGLSHCMKAVDFIVYLQDRIFYIEMKDLEHPNSSSANREKDIDRFLSGKIDNALKVKYRDSYLYEWSCKRTDKPIYYYVLIAISDLEPVQLLERTEALKKMLPLKGPSSSASPWCRQFVADCSVMDIDMWNKNMPNFQVSRRAS